MQDQDKAADQGEVPQPLVLAEQAQLGKVLLAVTVLELTEHHDQAVVVVVPAQLDQTKELTTVQEE